MSDNNNGHYEAIRTSLGKIHKKVDDIEDELIARIHALEIDLAVQKAYSKFIPITLSIIGGIIGIIAFFRGLK